MYEERTDKHELPWVVARDQIPSSVEPSDENVKIRRFLAHSTLGPAILGSAAAFAWIDLTTGRDVALRPQPTPSLLVVLHGSARLVSTETALLEAGDIVALQEGCEYGFTDVGVNGLRALLVESAPQAQTGSYACSLEHLIERNLLRSHAIRGTPYFRLLSDGGLDSVRSRTRFRECLRVFSDAFQVFLFTRQAMCRDHAFQTLFFEHLIEEIGHNEMLPSALEPRIATDPVLKATSSWFCQQMLVLDNADKAVVNLVLETAGYYFHSLASVVFKGDTGEKYFDTHAEADEHHKDVGVELLEGLHPDTYAHLYAVLEDSWNMLEAVTQRIFELVTEREGQRVDSTARASEIREILPTAAERRRNHA